jgi:hypothetical protein
VPALGIGLMHPKVHGPIIAVPRLAAKGRESLALLRFSPWIIAHMPDRQRAPRDQLCVVVQAGVHTLPQSLDSTGAPHPAGSTTRNV